MISQLSLQDRALQGGTHLTLLPRRHHKRRRGSSPIRFVVCEIPGAFPHYISRCGSTGREGALRGRCRSRGKRSRTRYDVHFAVKVEGGGEGVGYYALGMGAVGGEGHCGGS